MGAGRPPVLIAGAGIGGLSAAIGLARRGIACRLLERRAELSEAGAGIQLGPNAMHVLKRLGVAEKIAKAGGRPLRIEVAHGATGRHLGHLPLGDDIARRYGAPYLVCHRADLQHILAEEVARQPSIGMTFGFEVAGFEETSDGIGVVSREGTTEHGSALIGADGLWSSVRRLLHPKHPLTYAGKLAARTLIPADLAPARFRQPVTGVWLGPDAHVVHYPIRAGREIAAVVIVDEVVAREGWGGEIAAADVIHRLRAFAPDLIDALLLGPAWRAWSLYDPAPLPSWSRGKVGLIGDAAHPILPFLAQGGAMAIEDADTLAGLLSEDGASAEHAFTRFEALRRARVLKVQDASRENGRIYHMKGFTAWARNAALTVLPGQMMMQRYDWLYGWTGDRAPPATNVA